MLLTQPLVAAPQPSAPCAHRDIAHIVEGPLDGVAAARAARRRIREGLLAGAVLQQAGADERADGIPAQRAELPCPQQGSALREDSKVVQHRGRLIGSAGCAGRDLQRQSARPPGAE